MPDKRKVLIIDDDKDYGEAIKMVLESNGFDVKHVLNVHDGRKAVEADKPELIVLDVMMDKHTDGFDLCYDLKHDEKYKNIPILMVTAVTGKTGFKFSPETDGEYLQADDYISKPVASSELLQRVKKLLN
ncbi:MAG TPA: response regulator [Deltaproteobacteria bacterium]|nr:response regulator [Deltaproteobacteria bacterium]